jgi:predicted DNA-binding transcriptional regulator AlpA
MLNETKQPEVARLALSRKEAASALGVSVPTLDRLVQRGLLQPSRALRRPLFPVPEIERFLREMSGPITS